MSRPTRAIVDLAAIHHNYQIAKRLAQPARAVAVVKANAYGHGAVPVARHLDNHVDAFGVACIEEAIELREAGITSPILLLEGVFEQSELALVDELRLWTVVHSSYQIDWISAMRPRRALNIWLKMDSGMHRLGLDPAGLRDVYEQLRALPHVAEIVTMSHLARADETQSTYTNRQLDCFEQHDVTAASARSVANSAGVLGWPRSHRDWVRPGIMLYGASPMDHAVPDADQLKPAMRFQSAIIGLREVAAGEPVGYGQRYTCDQARVIGTVAAGYGDGYPRHARNGTPVDVNGTRTQLIGRVSMDMLTVDLTHIANPKAGDPVELWGADISVNEVAQSSDTIAYQLFTGITRRVPIDYVDTQ